MELCRFFREFEIAQCRSVVNVAIPQRRGNECPISDQEFLTIGKIVI